MQGKITKSRSSNHPLRKKERRKPRESSSSGKGRWADLDGPGEEGATWWASDDSDFNSELRLSASVQDDPDSYYFNPDADNENEQWVAAQASSLLPPVLLDGHGRPKRKTDALLSCPACSGLVCVDCQRYVCCFTAVVLLSSSFIFVTRQRYDYSLPVLFCSTMYFITRRGFSEERRMSID